MSNKKTMVYMGDDCELAIFCDEITADKEQIYGYKNNERVLVTHSDRVKIVKEEERETHYCVRIELMEAADES